MRAYPALSGEQAKQIAMFSHEVTSETFLETMRSRARAICLQFGRVSNDDLREYADSIRMEPPHHNAWGAVFRGSDWRCVGFVPSRVPSSKGRTIRQWTLK